MSDNGLSQVAKRLIRDLESGGIPQINFGALVRKFKAEIDQVMDEIAQFALKENQVKLFTEARHLQNRTMAGIGNHRIHFGGVFLNLQRAIEEITSDTIRDEATILQDACDYLKGRARGHSENRIVEIVCSTTEIAENLNDLIQKLQDLLNELEKDPEIKRERFRSIALGVTGVCTTIVALAMCFTPLVCTAPIVAQYAVHIFVAAGALGVAGGATMYRGFGKTLMDSGIKQAIAEYLQHKLDLVKKYKDPALDHHEQAQSLQDIIDEEFRGRVTVERLAQFVDSFNILCSTSKGDNQHLSLTKRVRRYLETKQPYIMAITGATALSVGSAVIASTAAKKNFCC